MVEPIEVLPMQGLVTEDDAKLRDALHTRLGAAQEHLRAAEAEVTRLKRLIEGLKEVLSTLGQPPPQTAQLFDLAFPQRLPDFDFMTIKEAAASLLFKHGRPMTVRDLFDALMQAGKKVGGKVPTETLRTTLRSYDTFFKKTPDAKWTLTKETAEKIAESVRAQ